MCRGLLPLWVRPGQRPALDRFGEVDIDQLGLIVRRAFQLHEIEAENRRLESQVGEGRTVLGTMITAAPEMLKVARTIEEIPDLYAQEFDITLPPYAAPVNGDRVVAFDLLPRPYRPWIAQLAYDEEKRGPLPDHGDVIRLILERRF